MAAHRAALAEDRVSFYTAPIKALVSEKFFALCEVFGADDVGMLTGDASVNADAPIICCTAEVLANIALREGARADVGLVVMDEFHFYAEPDRGWAWQVPLLELPQAQFLLMSATLGDVTDAGRRPDPAQRPGDGGRRRRRAPGAADLHLGADPARRDARGAGRRPTRRRSTSCTSPRRTPSSTPPRCSTPVPRPIAAADELAERLAGFRFGAGFGKTLSKLLRRGDRRPPRRDAAALPPPRRAARPGRAADASSAAPTPSASASTCRSGPCCSPALAKYDGNRQRVLRTREFLQIAGPRRPGRLRHRRVRRRPGARAHHREREGQGQVRRPRTPP